MKITFSAPAKIILSGEHSVVYGKPAFVSAIDMRLQFSIEESDKMAEDKSIIVLNNIVTNYLEKQKIEFKKRNFEYEINSDIPIGRGMGSSAAFCVAGVATLLRFYTGKIFEKEMVNSLAYLGEKHFHGMPSGVDVSASCFGGLIFYRKEFEFLKNISALNFKIPKNIQDHLLLIDTGKPEENTAKMVTSVGEGYNKDPKHMEEVLIKTEKITKRMVVSVVKEDPQMFADCIAENQKLLVNLGIVSESTEKLLKDLEKFGVGKVTGAGGKKEGSGFVLFFSDDEEGLKKYLDGRNISCFKFNQDFEGVKEVK